MMKTFFILLLCFCTIGLAYAQRGPGNLEFDAVSFARDSGKIQVELYYSVLQRSLNFKENNGKWIAPIHAKYQVFQNDPVWGGLCIDDKGVYWETLVEMAAEFDRQDDLILLQVRPDNPPESRSRAANFFTPRLDLRLDGVAHRASPGQFFFGRTFEA